MPFVIVGLIAISAAVLWYLSGEKKRRVRAHAEKAGRKVRESEMILLADIESLRRVDSPLLADAIDLRRRQLERQQ